MGEPSHFVAFNGFLMSPIRPCWAGHWWGLCASACLPDPPNSGNLGCSWDKQKKGSCTGRGVCLPRWFSLDLRAEEPHRYGASTLPLVLLSRCPSLPFSLERRVTLELYVSWEPKPTLFPEVSAGHPGLGTQSILWREGGRDRWTC